MDYAACYKKELKNLMLDEGKLLFFTTKLKNLYTQDYEEYKKLLDFLIKYTESTGLIIARLWLNNYKCWCLYYELKYDDAINLAANTYSTLEKYDFKPGMASLCNSLMAFYSQIGKIDLSSDWGIRGVLIAEELNDSDLMFTLMLNICIGYLELEQYDIAKEILDYISNKKFKMGNNEKVMYLLCNAEVEINIGDSNLAIDLLLSIYEYKDSINLSYYLGEIIKLEALAYCKIKEYKKSDELFKQSYKLCKKSNDKFQMCSCLYSYATLYTEIHEYKKSYETIEIIIANCVKYNYSTILLKTYRLAYKVCKQNSNILEALSYLEKYISLNEKINERKVNNWHNDVNVGRVEREAKLYKILYDKTELLSTIGRDVLSTLDENMILSTITREIQKLMKAKIFSIALYNSEKNEITYKYIGRKSETITEGPFKLGYGNTLSEYCIKYGKDIIINDITKEYKLFDIEDINLLYNYDKAYHSVLFTPMYVKDKVVGIMTVQDVAVGSFSKNDLNTLKILSNYVAAALYNAIQYKHMEIKAAYDYLTGVYSRSEIMKFGENAFEDSCINKIAFTVAMIDIDKLKNLNDNYGHVVGDNVLRKVTENIQINTRKQDYCGRYGGDEFLLLFTNTHIDEAYTISEKIRTSIENDAVIVNKDEMYANISVGLYELKECDKTFMSCVNKADKALYEAKKLYGNKIIKYTDYN